MTTEKVKRKLTAILSADVKGYSRLMGADEVGTIRILQTYRGVISDLIQKKGGRVVDSPGDNVLAEFASVVDALESAVEAAFGEARRLDRMLSNYRSESEWTRMNREASQKPVEVSTELFQLLEYCAEVNRQSEGTFDISVGPLMRVWGFFRDTGHLPEKTQVTTALEKVGFSMVKLDPEKRTVRFLKAGVELDPGGIGKGYAVDRMVEKLREQKVVFEELIFPDEIHDLLRWSDWVRAYRSTAEFFDHKLAASPPQQ